MNKKNNPLNFDMPSVQIQLQQQLSRAGISYAAIVPAQTYSERQAQYQTWLARNYHGTMQYLAHHADAKYCPEKILAQCQSVIMVVMNYYQPCSTDLPPGYGKISRYAWGRDYHKTLGNRLHAICREMKTAFPYAQWISFTDATPLDERWYAMQAGLGFLAANTLLVSPGYGTWCFLGEILTTASLQYGCIPLPGIPLVPNLQSPDMLSSISPSVMDLQNHRIEKFCATCRRCLHTCPTGALLDMYHKDNRRCLSYLTIEHRGLIPVEFHPKLGSWLLGCDICQEVCPYNQHAIPTTETDFTTWKAGFSQPLQDVLAIPNEAEYRARYAGTPLMRARRSGLVRNACIVAANQGCRNLIPQIKQLQYDSDPIIAQTAAISYQRMMS